MSEHYFSPCPRGLEALLVDELRALGAANIETVPGGVAFSGDWPLCWRANLESRIATRVLWRVSQGSYRSEDDIYALARAVPWEKCFGVDNTLRIYVTAIKAPLKSLNFVTLRIKDGVCDRFRETRAARPSIDTERPDIRLHAFLTADTCTLYVDTSGEPLTKRGFKRAKVEAPLKENLAAGLLKLSGWQPHEPLLDPMCGSGTFLIEAAQMALDIPPGSGRSFAFERLSSFDSGIWKRLRTLAQQRRKRGTGLQLFGADIDSRQVEATRANLDAAGLEAFGELRVCDVLELPPPAEQGVWLTNPPYGVRLGEESALADWYPKLGDHLKHAFAGWRCHFFSGDPELPKRIGLKASRRTPLMNGDIECRLYAYEVVAGFMRRDKAMPKD